MVSVLSANAVPSSSSLSESAPKLNMFSWLVWATGDRGRFSEWKTCVGSICWDIPKDPGALNELEGAAPVVAVNMGAAALLYMYGGAIELERLDGARVKG